MLQALYKNGRYFFAFALIAFGFIQINVQDFMGGFLPVVNTLPARTFFMYVTSIIFIILGIGMCIKNVSSGAARLAGLFFLLLLIYPHLVSLLGDLHNPAPWTSSAEDLAFAGGAWIIAGAIDYDGKNSSTSSSLRIGKILFALSLLVFAVQHFMYAEFIANLVPAWIPFKLFFAYFVGAAFVLSSVSIFTGIRLRLAGALLGFMYLFWTIFLHLPRVAADTHKETEKTSLFIAFAFSGIFFTLASVSGKNSRPNQ
jgi:uncharacterized membrane protein